MYFPISPISCLVGSIIGFSYSKLTTILRSSSLKLIIEPFYLVRHSYNKGGKSTCSIAAWRKL